MTDGLGILDRRPLPGAPRQYDFPAFRRQQLDNGLELLQAHVPGRPLLQAQLIIRGDKGGGATSEARDEGGVSSLAARAMPEGTETRDALAFIEAAERLGAEIGAVAGWDSLSAHVEVPRSRLAAAMELFAEMVLRPAFPEREVERLRDERLNDLRQAMADPRRRAELAFPAVIYAEAAAYARPTGGLPESVGTLGRDAVVARHAQLLRPEASTLIVCGDLDGIALEAMVERVFGSWPGADGSAPEEPVAPDAAAGPRRVVLIDRPGAPQSEIRIGHVGTARRVEDFHALSVTNALLGGLFNSRLNRLLREERGYTYGVTSSFDMRRAAGPFAVRCAVETAVTLPAIEDLMSELGRIREGAPERSELAAARDYLVGVFPLRFETSAQVAAALAGLVVNELPDDELDRYRPAVAAVSAEDALAAAQAHIDPAAASIVVVGDAEQVADGLQAAGYGDVEVIHDETPDEAGDA